MLTKLQIVKIAAAFVVAHDLRSSYKNKQIFKTALERNVELAHINEMMIDTNARLAEDLNAVSSQVDYLIHVLNENGIAPDEFDLIALRNPM